MLGGDLNVDLLVQSNNSDFFNVLYSYNYFPLISIATRVTDVTAKCLNQIWYNKLNVTCAGSIVSDVTDHYPVFAIVDRVDVQDIITRTFRDHSENIRQLCSNVRNMCSEFIVSNLNFSVDEKCELFLTKLWNLYNRDCPIKVKSISVKKFMKPWITNEIRRMANYKHYLFKQYKRNNISFHVYNTYKNNLSKIIKISKRSYFRNTF